MVYNVDFLHVVYISFIYLFSGDKMKKLCLWCFCLWNTISVFSYTELKYMHVRNSEGGYLYHLMDNLYIIDIEPFLLNYI